LDPLQESVNSFEKAQERVKKSLNSAHEKVLGYFWNEKSQRIRTRIPTKVILFFESDALNNDLKGQGPGSARTVVLELIDKGYLEKIRVKDIAEEILLREFGKEEFLTPTAQGVEWIKNKHPTVLMYWERIRQLFPSWVNLLVTLIGLVASIFGIIQFVL
jgi:hypothetical protein